MDEFFAALNGELADAVRQALGEPGAQTRLTDIAGSIAGGLPDKPESAELVALRFLRAMRPTAGAATTGTIQRQLSRATPTASRSATGQFARKSPLVLSDQQMHNRWETSAELQTKFKDRAKALLGETIRKNVKQVDWDLLGETFSRVGWDPSRWEAMVGEHFRKGLVSNLVGVFGKAAYSGYRQALTGLPDDLSERDYSEIVGPFAREYAMRMATNTEVTSANAIRQSLSRFLEDGLPERTIANYLKLIGGLNPRQALALDNYRRGLGQKGNKPGVIMRLVNQYANTLLEQRKEMIAQTEMMTAINFGRQLMYERAILEGKLPPSTQKCWVTARDELVCPVCRPMDGRCVRVQANFEIRDGSVVVPPAHTRCRCLIVVRNLKGESRDIADFTQVEMPEDLRRDVRKHGGPGKHESGTAQTVHGLKEVFSSPTKGESWGQLDWKAKSILAGMGIVGTAALATVITRSTAATRIVSITPNRTGQLAGREFFHDIANQSIKKGNYERLSSMKAKGTEGKWGIFTDDVLDSIQGSSWDETVENVERLIRTKSVEHSFIVDSDGAILSGLRGTETGVPILNPTTMPKRMADRITAIHNHPTVDDPLSTTDFRGWMQLTKPFERTRVVTKSGHVSELRKVADPSDAELGHALQQTDEFTKWHTGQITKWMDENPKAVSDFVARNSDLDKSKLASGLQDEWQTKNQVMYGDKLNDTWRKLTDEADWLEYSWTENVRKHLGPNNHPSGTSQAVHAGGDIARDAQAASFLVDRSDKKGVYSEMADTFGKEYADQVFNGVYAWQTSFKKVRRLRSLLDGSVQPGEGGRSARRADDSLLALHGLVQQAPKGAPKLYRGMYLKATPDEIMDTIRKGKVLESSVASFSESKEIADNYALSDVWDVFRRGRTSISIEVDEGAASLPLEPLDVINEVGGIDIMGSLEEHIVRGPLKVTDVRKVDENHVSVKVKQVDEAVSKADASDVLAEALFFPFHGARKPKVSKHLKDTPWDHDQSEHASREAKPDISPLEYLGRDGDFTTEEKVAVGLGAGIVGIGAALLSVRLRHLRPVAVPLARNVDRGGIATKFSALRDKLLEGGDDLFAVPIEKLDSLDAPPTSLGFDDDVMYGTFSDDVLRSMEGSSRGETLEFIERTIKGFEFEHGFWVDDSGKVLGGFRGDTKQVIMPRPEKMDFDDFQGLTFTHNHPISSAPLSAADMRAWITESPVREIRAVTNDGHVSRMSTNSLFDPSKLGQAKFQVGEFTQRMEMDINDEYLTWASKESGVDMRAVEDTFNKNAMGPADFDALDDIDFDGYMEAKEAFTVEDFIRGNRDWYRDSMNARLGEFAENHEWAQYFWDEAIRKHLRGQHDQKEHGNWAERLKDWVEDAGDFAKDWAPETMAGAAVAGIGLIATRGSALRFMPKGLADDLLAKSPSLVARRLNAGEDLTKITKDPQGISSGTLEAIKEFVSVRGGTDSIRAAADMSDPPSYVRQFVNTLARAPKSSPKLYRGIKINRNDLDKFTTVGDDVTMGPSSFSSDPWFGQYYAVRGTSGQEVPPPASVIFKLPRNSRALRVEKVSTYEEAEWIAGGRFRVKRSREAYRWKGRDVWEVDLEEVSPLAPFDDDSLAEQVLQRSGTVSAGAGVAAGGAQHELGKHYGPGPHESGSSQDVHGEEDEFGFEFEPPEYLDDFEEFGPEPFDDTVADELLALGGAALVSALVRRPQLLRRVLDFRRGRKARRVADQAEDAIDQPTLF